MRSFNILNYYNYADYYNLVILGVINRSNKILLIVEM